MELTYSKNALIFPDTTWDPDDVADVEKWESLSSQDGKSCIIFHIDHWVVSEACFETGPVWRNTESEGIFVLVPKTNDAHEFLLDAASSNRIS